jgi:hypothetical protein
MQMPLDARHAPSGKSALRGIAEEADQYVECFEITEILLDLPEVSIHRGELGFNLFGLSQL